MEGRGVRNCHVGESALGLVIPANAGIHLLPTSFLLSSQPETDNMDSRFRGNDDGRMGSRVHGNDDGQVDASVGVNDEWGADTSARYSYSLSISAAASSMRKPEILAATASKNRAPRSGVA